MQEFKPPATISNSKKVTIIDATLRDKLLFDNRSKLEKQKVNLEAFVVDEQPENGHEVLYSQTLDCDYVIQPRGMRNRGSMCVTELYGKDMRLKVVQTLIEKKKREDQT